MLDCKNKRMFVYLNVVCHNMKKIRTILILLFLALKIYGQNFNVYNDFYQILSKSTEINFVDKEGRKQGRFVFCIEPNKDTLETKIIVYYKNDSLISDWICYNADSTYETGKFKLNKTYERLGILHHFYPQKVGIWKCYNFEGEYLYYISYNKDKKSNYSYDTIYNSKGNVLKYYLNKGYIYEQADYKNGIRGNFEKSVGGRMFSKITKREYYESGVLRKETIKKERLRTINQEKIYSVSGLIQFKTKEVRKHRKTKGVGEKWAHYSIRTRKEWKYDENGKLIECKKYKNDELIK